MYVPIHLHTYWSLLDSTVDITELVNKAVEYKIPALCLTDHMNIKGVVPFFKTCNSKGVKPIIGIEADVYIPKYDVVQRITLLAKNKRGYKNIVRLISKANSSSNLDENFEPRLLWEDLQTYRRDLVCLLGDIKSPLAYAIFEKWDMAYKANSLEICRSLLHEDWEERFCKMVDRYQNTFEEVYLFGDDGNLPMIEAIRKCTQYMCKKHNWKYLPSNNVHYLNKEDADLHKLILKSYIDINKSDFKYPELVNDFRIFLSEYDCETWLKPYRTEKTDWESFIDNFEEFEIKENPLLPQEKIKSYKDENIDEKLKKICQDGFVKLGLIEELNSNKKLKEVYVNRIKEELEIFKKANLSGYFLVVHDIINFGKSCGMPMDIRGSATGCMISYLAGFSTIDPLRPDPTLPYDPARELPFSRFYNRARNVQSRVSFDEFGYEKFKNIN